MIFIVAFLIENLKRSKYRNKGIASNISMVELK